MIHGLRGTVHTGIEPDRLVLETASGVWYDCHWGSPLVQLPAAGAVCTVWTHVIIREDQWTLYAFADTQAQWFFRTVLKASGVGPKLAQAIVASVPVDAFARCVHEADWATLARVPGIGKKTAERLLMDLKGRFEGMPWLVHAAVSDNAGATSVAASVSVATAAPSHASHSVWQDAQTALQALGYSAGQAYQAVSRVRADKPEPLTTETVLKAALRHCALPRTDKSGA